MSTPTQPEDSNMVWPTIPPRKGQSPVLFDDGYAEGWAKCIAECKAAVDLAAPQQAGGDATLEAIRQIIVEEGSGFLEVRDAYGSIQGLLAAAPAAPQQAGGEASRVGTVVYFAKAGDYGTVLFHERVRKGDAVYAAAPAAAEPSDDAKAAQMLKRVLEWRNPNGTIADAYLPKWLADEARAVLSASRKPQP